MSASVPRVKPWEAASGTSAASVGAVADANMNSTLPHLSLSVQDPTSTLNPASTGAPPAVARPATLSLDTSSYMGASTSYASRPVGGYGGGHGGYGYGLNMYGGGGYGLSMYGGGGYGLSMYGGGYGLSMYGGGGYGLGMYGMNNMNGMQGGGGGLGEGTQATFQLIESIIGAVGGFAQMLEATYMATHSSFYTMVSLAEQFGNLKNALGSLLGIFALIRFLKKILYKITGSKLEGRLSLKEFQKFESKKRSLEQSTKSVAGGKPRISFKPLFLFLAASIGLPYLLGKVIQKLNAQNQARLGGYGGQTLDPSQIDLTHLQFAKALYEFNPENPSVECPLKANELVAILSKTDPLGGESQWWKVRSRLGEIGYVPSNYLSVIDRKVERRPDT